MVRKPAGKTNLETAVEFLPRPRRPGLSPDHWLRPRPAKTDHFFAGVNNLEHYNEKWFENKMQNWETTINYYLRTGKKKTA